MIVEMRTYTLKIGKVAEYLELYKLEALEAQVRHLGQPFGYYSTETGMLNQLIHMWAYDGLEDRAKRREALYNDPQWRTVLPKLFDLIEQMDSKILNPAFFVTPQACRMAKMV